LWDVGLHTPQALDLRFDHNQRVRVKVKIATFSSFADRASLRNTVCHSDLVITVGQGLGWDLAVFPVPHPQFQALVTCHLWDFTPFHALHMCQTVYIKLYQATNDCTSSLVSGKLPHFVGIWLNSLLSSCDLHTFWHRAVLREVSVGSVHESKRSWTCLAAMRSAN